MNWALTEAPVESAQEHIILIALADRAHSDGTAAWPSQAEIAQRARCSTRTVRRYLKALEERGVIRRGDQSLVAHLSADSRPIVWDLNLAAAPVDNHVSDDRSRVSARPSRVKRPDISGSHGRTLLSYKPSFEPSMEPSTTPAPTQRPPRRMGVVVSRSAEGKLDDLVSACRDASLPARWDALKQEQADAIAALIETHGIPALIQAAKRAHRPDNPTRYAQGYIGAWSMIPTPRATAQAWSSCGRCDEHGWIGDPADPYGPGLLCPCVKSRTAVAA